MQPLRQARTAGPGWDGGNALRRYVMAASASSLPASCRARFSRPDGPFSPPRVAGSRCCRVRLGASCAGVVRHGGLRFARPNVDSLASRQDARCSSNQMAKAAGRPLGEIRRAGSWPGSDGWTRKVTGRVDRGSTTCGIENGREQAHVMAAVRRLFRKGRRVGCSSRNHAVIGSGRGRLGLDSAAGQ